ncbi:MAG: hypothetical protein HFE28_04780 [Clostridia bacterium]|jgi:hypothetical protein|nr:hypothetical protein [Clostridia bacterium]
MVGKLMKHELRALFRVILAVGLSALVLSGVAALFVWLNPQGYLGILLFFLSIMMSSVLLFVGIIFSIRQFYASLFTGEGYMTFSLPVTPMQLLWSKLISALLASLFCSVIAILSWLMLFGSLSPTIIQELGVLFGDLFDVILRAIASDPLLVVEFALLILVSIPSTTLCIYSVISIGQLFTNHRKAITLVMGIALIYVVLPMLSNFCLTPILEAAAKVSLHLPSWICIFLFAGCDVGMFFLIRYIMLHRVNLIV